MNHKKYLFIYLTGHFSTGEGWGGGGVGGGGCAVPSTSVM